MKKIIYLLLILVCLFYIKFNNQKTIVTESIEYFAVPSTCTSQNNCEKILINDSKWFENWRENEATIMPDGQMRNYANIVFLIDVSGSMQNNTELNYISQTVKMFVNSLKDEDMIGIANYTPVATQLGNSSFDVKIKSIIRKEISNDKTYNETLFQVPSANSFQNIEGSAFQYLSSQMVPTSQWSYDIIIWLTDSYDDTVFEQLAGGKNLLDYGIKLYMVNIGNSLANVSFFGQKTKETYGKYYFVDIAEPITGTVEENQCAKMEYAKENPGTCCKEYPETCCNNKDFINKNWSSFTGDKAWYKTYCCNQTSFKTSNPDKCKVEQKIETCDGSDDFCSCMIKLFVFLGHIMNIIKIGVPIIMILLGSIDFAKALVAQKDDDMKKATNIFMKRAIYAVIVFFVTSLVSFGVGLVGGDTNNRCFKCVANVNGSVCNKENLPKCCKK